MTPFKTRVVTAWHEVTGLRFKGRIHGNDCRGIVRTPYGVFRYDTWYDFIQFYELMSEFPQCPLVPEMNDVTDETPEGDLVLVSSVLPYRMPNGYKAMEYVDGVGYAIRLNGVRVLMDNQ